MKKITVFAIISIILASCSPVTVVNPLPTAVNALPTVAAPNGVIPLTGTIGKNAAPSSTAGKGIPNFDHIVLILLENRSYQDAVGPSSQMPLLNSIATNNVLLANYYAITHPSLPNYISIMSGSTQGITSDCVNCYVNAPNLADEIKASGRTWKAYLESLPSPCFVGNSGEYAQKHNPLIYFDSIRLNASLCNNSFVPLTNLDTDLSNNQLPNFAYIMPNLCDSGHSCAAAKADQWVSGMVSKLQSSTALGNNSLIIVAFDEADTSDTSGCCGLPAKAGGHIAVVLISPTAQPHMTDSTAYDHYSLLKTILTAWNLPALGHTADPATPVISAPWGGTSNNSTSPSPTQTTVNNNILPGVQANTCDTSAASSGKYVVKICIANPANGSTLSNNVTISAEITTNGKASGVKRVVYKLGSAYLLTAFASPYSFILPTNKLDDGTYTLSASAQMQDGFTTGSAAITVNISNGTASEPVNTGNFTPTSGTSPAPGQPFILAAAGDGAGGEPTTTKVIDLIKSLNPNLFLYLGDVYESGSMAEFYNWYGSGTDWYSQFRPITDPTIGNHEYLTNNGANYFDYWNNVPNYYSVNAGGWHIISLNANAPKFDVSTTSPEYQWLQQDLTANTLPCTIAFWHEPIFNVGTEKPQTLMLPIWALLAQHGVSIVLNGHDHDYQRWMPLDGNGQPNPNGITEFIAGGGGHGTQKIIQSDSRVAYANGSSPAAMGVLILMLSQNGANFSYHSINGTILDSGFVSCKSAQ